MYSIQIGDLCVYDDREGMGGVSVQNDVGQLCYFGEKGTEALRGWLNKRAVEGLSTDTPPEACSICYLLSHCLDASVENGSKGCKEMYERHKKG